MSHRAVAPQRRWGKPFVVAGVAMVLIVGVIWTVNRAGAPAGPAIETQVRPTAGSWANQAAPDSDSATGPAMSSAALRPSDDQPSIETPNGETTVGLESVIATPDSLMPTSDPTTTSHTESLSGTTTTAVASQCPGLECVSLVVTGDVLLHPPLWEQAIDDAQETNVQTPDFGPLLAGQRGTVTAADFAICHLETPLGPDVGPFQGYPNFVVPPMIADALVRTGYDGCSTASNHSFDDGTSGINRTLDTLDRVGLAHNGTARTPNEAAEPTLIERGGVILGLVSGTYGQNGPGPDNDWQITDLTSEGLISQATRARQAGADIVVVAIHAGIEYRTEPTAFQQQLAKDLLASEYVDFVVGHHAHVVQPLAQINGKWVAYGLGNNVAAHGIDDQRNREGLLVRVQFSRDTAGKWTTTAVGWLPSLMSSERPYRWCSPSISQGPCNTSPADAEMIERTAEAVNSLGADLAGAQMLDRDHSK